MAAPKITAPRGTADVYPPESAEWNRLEARIRSLAHRFGYGEIRTPIFEATELFVRGVGETTDIVEKEMYTFVDKGGRSMTLRPEWTAPVVRAVLQHNLLARGPLRLYYIGPFFRYERPQAGRYRQANQFGVECFGYAEPEADVEVMQLAMALVLQHGITDAKLRINSIGDAHCRPAYREALLAHFRPHAAELSEDSQRRLERNPLRLLDSKAPADAPFIANAPRFIDYLCSVCGRSPDRPRFRLLHADRLRDPQRCARSAERALRRRPLRRARRVARRAADARRRLRPGHRTFSDGAARAGRGGRGAAQRFSGHRPRRVGASLPRTDRERAAQRRRPGVHGVRRS